MKELFSEQSEKNALGALMMWNEHAKSAANLQIHELFTDAHRKILAAIRKLEDTGVDPNFIAVWHQMQEQGSDGAISGMSYLDEISTGLPRRYDPVKDVATIRKMTRLRSIYAMAEGAIQQAEDGEDADEILYKMQAGVFEQQTESKQLVIRSMAEVMVEVVDSMRQQRDRTTDLLGITTGIDLLDRCTTGWREGELTYVGALPGRGKTSFLLQAMHAAVISGHKAGCISLEMRSDQLGRRLTVIHSGMHAGKFRDAKTMNPSEWKSATEAAWSVGDLQIQLCDQSGLRPSQISALARRMAKNGAEIIFVDFVQIIQEDGKDRREAINRVSAALRDTCKALNIPFVVASQLARRDSDPNRRPTIQDLRESGNLEQDAHNVMLLYRPKDKSTGEWTGEDEIIIDKAREGMTGIVPVVYDNKSLIYKGRQ